MSVHFGSQIRKLRKHRDLDIKELASRLNVSVGYLSNLETGKTETISFSFLEKLQKELNYSPLQKNCKNTEELYNRTEQVKQQLTLLSESHPEKAFYLLMLIEDGIRLLND